MPRTFSWNAFETGTDSPVTSGSTTISVDSVLGLQAPLYLVIDPDSDTKREYIFVGALGASSLDNVTRGLASSAAGAQNHDSGIRIRAVAVHQWLDDLWDGVEDNETGLANHIVNADPHTQYLTQTEADARYINIAGDSMTGALGMNNNLITGLGLSTGTGSDAANVDYVDNSLSTHGAAADPHANYLLAAGDTMSGALNMGNSNKIVSMADPTLAQDAATKQYVDDQDALQLALAGGTMSGAIDMANEFLLNPQNPTLDTQVGDRGYNDGRYATTAEGVSNGDSHDHAGGDGAQITHGGLGGVGASDHHTKFTDADAVSAVSAGDDYLRNTGDASSGTLQVPTGSETAPGLRTAQGANHGLYGSGEFTGVAANGAPVIVGNGTDQLYIDRAQIATGTGDDLQIDSGNQIRRVVSSRRFKENIREIPKEFVRRALKALPLYEFNYIGDDRVQVGWMAEDVASVDPRLVMWEDNLPRSIDWRAVLAVMA